MSFVEDDELVFAALYGPPGAEQSDVSSDLECATALNLEQALVCVPDERPTNRRPRDSLQESFEAPRCSCSWSEACGQKQDALRARDSLDALRARASLDALRARASLDALRARASLDALQARASLDALRAAAAPVQMNETRQLRVVAARKAAESAWWQERTRSSLPTVQNDKQLARIAARRDFVLHQLATRPPSGCGKRRSEARSEHASKRSRGASGHFAPGAVAASASAVAKPAAAIAVSTTAVSVATTAAVAEPPPSTLVVTVTAFAVSAAPPSQKEMQTRETMPVTAEEQIISALSQAGAYGAYSFRVPGLRLSKAMRVSTL